MNPCYTVFSDESYISAERYRSVSSVSLPTDAVPKLSQEIRGKLDESDIQEFKWKKLTNAKYRFGAEKIISLVMRWLHKGLRIDTIIWDTYDSRHDIPGRDDRANLGRMYFHLLKSVMTRRENGAIWQVFPDENVEVNWEKVNECLSHVGKWEEVLEYPLLGLATCENLFEVETFEQVRSNENTICQAADLFAGVSVFSIHNYDKYTHWKKEKMQQLSLLTDAPLTLSKREQARLPILDLFVTECKKRSLGVSIDQNKRLWTPNPKNPINFWNYTPQHEHDKAPIRGG